MVFHLQKLYIVCDVALFVMANKSTASHLDSPKDPVLPAKFFIVQDKASVLFFCKLTYTLASVWGTKCVFEDVNDPYFGFDSSVQDFKNDKEYLSTEMRQMLLTGKVNAKHGKKSKSLWFCGLVELQYRCLMCDC